MEKKKKRNRSFKKSTLTVLVYFWKQEIKFPFERCPLCTIRKEDIPTTRNGELRLRNPYKQTLL